MVDKEEGNKDKNLRALGAAATRKRTSIGLLQEASLVNPTMSLKNMVTSSNSSASTES